MKVRLACAAVAVVCLFGPARLSADEIIDWNNVLLDTVRTNSMSPSAGDADIGSDEHGHVRRRQFDRSNASSIPRGHDCRSGDESRSRRRSGCPPRTERLGSGEPGNVRRGAGKQLIQCARRTRKDGGNGFGKHGRRRNPGPTGKRWRQRRRAIHARNATRRVEADSTSERPGSRPAVGQRDPVGHDQPLPVPESRRSTRFGQRRIHGRIQPGERDRLCDQHHADTRSIKHRAVLGRPSGHLHSAWALEQDCSDGCRVPG